MASLTHHLMVAADAVVPVAPENVDFLDYFLTLVTSSWAWFACIFVSYTYDSCFLNFGAILVGKKPADSKAEGNDDYVLPECPAYSWINLELTEVEIALAKFKKLELNEVRARVKLTRTCELRICPENQYVDSSANCQNCLADEFPDDKGHGCSKDRGGALAMFRSDPAWADYAEATSSSFTNVKGYWSDKTNGGGALAYTSDLPNYQCGNVMVVNKLLLSDQD